MSISEYPRYADTKPDGLHSALMGSRPDLRYTMATLLGAEIAATSEQPMRASREDLELGERLCLELKMRKRKNYECVEIELCGHGVAGAIKLTCGPISQYLQILHPTQGRRAILANAEDLAVLAGASDDALLWLCARETPTMVLAVATPAEAPADRQGAALELTTLLGIAMGEYQLRMRDTMAPAETP